jgi:hypothetical protein
MADNVRNVVVSSLIPNTGNIAGVIASETGLKGKVITKSEFTPVFNEPMSLEDAKAKGRIQGATVDFNGSNTSPSRRGTVTNPGA